MKIDQLKQLIVVVVMTSGFMSPPWSQAEQIPGTSVEITCEANDKLKLQLIKTNENGKKKAISKKAAAKQLKKARKRLRAFEKTNNKLLNVTEKANDDATIAEFLSKSEQRHLNKHVKDAQKFELTITGPAPGAPLMVPIPKELQKPFVEGILKVFNEEMPGLQEAWKQQASETRGCSGCEDGEVKNQVLRLTRKRKKRKCDCFTKTVPATFSTQIGSDPNSPGDCGAVTFLQWDASETENATSWEAHYTWFFQDPDPRSKTSSPPFDDTYYYYPTAQWSAPSGLHWIQLIFTYGSAEDCANHPNIVAERMSNPYLEATICPAQ